MLNSETKKHIDAARDVLVGVTPNPATQIDQITYALIYKFMDDMDQAAIKAGGEPSFFVGDLEKYSWSRLMDSRVGNQERMNQYSEALQKFSEAKQLPELFRTIFRAAFLPYRSPETLGLFLKEIAYFDYKHSEELGNAYEYLLSIMSSQGDAGQFRTPRHIIDFIVDVINPTKDDKVLDPACGTAGFLISAYNHILEQHDGKNDPSKKEKTLTPEERKKLMQNLEGYDIDPTMVRIAQVNMYLHQFKNPKIFQYDSLTSEERWNDKFDVILANPPFMSPKGGIKPHNKFGIQSNRSEVLFIDYIINHLKPNGRAAIIVPEGVIFQNGNAYKQLRKSLVEGGLYSVVSLPPGVFNPYSGVKTSVLLINSQLAKQRDEILFVKVSNDGYDLGATKRPIEKNDLPEALVAIRQWTHLGSNSSRLVKGVSKLQIAESGGFGLSADRYSVSADRSSNQWSFVRLEEIVDYEQPTKYLVSTQNYDSSYPTPVLTAGKTFILGYTDEVDGIYEGPFPVIIFDDFTTASKLVNFPFKVKSSAMKLLHVERSKALPSFVYYMMQNINFPFSEHKRYWISEYSKLDIPLPPIEVQEEIVAEFDGFTAVIDGAKKISENWKPKIYVDPNWNLEKLKNLCEVITKGTTPTSIGYEFVSEGINFLKVESIGHHGQFIESKFAYISEGCHETLGRSKLKDGDILFSIAGALGRSALVSKEILPANINQALAILRLKTDAPVDRRFLRYLLSTDFIRKQSEQNKTGVAQQNLSLSQIGSFEVPVPPIELQLEIVSEIIRQESLVKGATDLAQDFESRINGVITKLWN